MSHIFISYSRKDIEFAQKIVDALAENDMDTWFDLKSIPKGEDWEQEIYRGIEEADAFLFLLSPDSIISEMCNKEIAHAVANGKRILPIVIRDADVENFLFENAKVEISKRNWIFCRERQDDSEVAIAETYKTIHTDYEWLKFHTELQVKALKWEQKKDASRLLRGKELRDSEKQLAEISSLEDPQPTKLQREYILASQRNEGRTRRQITIGLVVVLGIMIVLSVIARRQQKEAVSQRSAAEAASTLAVDQEMIAKKNLARTESLRLAAEAENIMIQPYGNVETAVLLSVRALQGGYIPQADVPLQKSLPLLYTMRTFSGHTDTVLSVAFSPDGKYMMTGSLDKTAKLWDIASGGEVRTFTGHAGSVESVAFSPDGKYVLTGSSDKTAKLWDAATGAEVRTFSNPTSIVRTSVEMKRSNHSVAFSPDGKYVLTASDDGTPKLWDAATGALLRTFLGHTNIVRSVAFSPDGKYVLTGGLDNTARIWDTATGAEVRTFQHTSWVLSVAFSPDGKYILTGTTGDAKLWDASTSTVVHTYIGDAAAAVSVAFSPDGKYVLTGSLGQPTANLWDADSGTLARTFSGHTDSVYSVAFSPDGNYMLTGSLDSTAKLWDAAGNAEVRTFRGHTDSVSSVAFSPDGKYVLTGSSDRTAKLWDAATYAEVRTFSGHTDIVESVAFSSDGKYVLTGSSDRTAKLWDAATYAEVRTFSGHMDTVASVTFSPDGKYVLTGGGDRTAKLWDATTGALVRTLRGHTQSVTGVAFSPDGKYLLTGSADWDAKLWDVATGAEVRTYKGGSSVQVVAFSPDGKAVLTGDLERTATLWDAATGVEVRTFSGHTSYVLSVDFSPDGKYVLTGSGDRTAKLWDVASGAEVRTFGGHMDVVAGVAFSPDGKYVLIGSMDKTVELWDMDISDTIRWACSHLTRDLTPEERAHYFITDNKITCPVGGPGLVISTMEPTVSKTTIPGSTIATFTVEPPSSNTAPSLTTEVNVSDSFDDNKYGWPVLQQWNDNGNLQDLKVQNGELDWNIDCALNDGCIYLWVPDGMPAVSDFNLSVDVKRAPKTTNGYAGIVFRVVNESNYYMFVYNDADGAFFIWKVVDNTATTIANWETSSAINSNQFNRLRVEAAGFSFNFFINGIKVYSAEITGISSGMVGVAGGNFSSDKISLVFDKFDLSGPTTSTTTPTTILEVTHNPNPAKFQTGGASGGAYTCAYKTSVKAVGAGVQIEKFGMYFWENNQWVHSTSNNSQPWSPDDFADWYSCPGAYIGPGQECSDSNNWTGADTSHLSKGKWYYVGMDENGNEVQGEAVIECQP